MIAYSTCEHTNAPDGSGIPSTGNADLFDKNYRQHQTLLLPPRVVPNISMTSTSSAKHFPVLPMWPEHFHALHG